MPNLAALGLTVDWRRKEMLYQYRARDACACWRAIKSEFMTNAIVRAHNFAASSQKLNNWRKNTRTNIIVVFIDVYVRIVQVMRKIA